MIWGRREKSVFFEKDDFSLRPQNHKITNYLTNPFFINFSSVIINIACDHPKPITHAGAIWLLSICSARYPCFPHVFNTKSKHSLAFLCSVLFYRAPRAKKK